MPLTIARVAAILDATDLASASKAQYLRKYRALIELMGGVDDLMPILRNAVTTIAALEAAAVKGQWAAPSRHAFAVAALAAFKYVPALHSNSRTQAALWKTHLDSVQAGIMATYMANEPNERQLAGYVPLHTIIQAHDALPKASIERLLLGMYALIPTRRCDFANTHIYPSAAEVPVTETDNYIVLPPVSHRTHQTELVMQAYKTAARYKAVRQVLPLALVADIRDSLTAQPRDLLFVSSRNGMPYASEHAFGKWANATLKRIFGRPLTITLIRHSYVSDMKLDDMTTQDREDVAILMGHSRSTADIYRFRLPKDAKQCTCTCA